MRGATLGACALTFALPTAAWASGGAHHGFDWQFGANFLILVVALVLLLRKKLRAALEARATGIRKDMDDAARELGTAEALEREKQAHLRGLEADRDKILSRFRDDAARERTRLVAEAQARAARIRSETERQAEAERRQVEDELRARVVDEAFGRARSRLAREMDEGKKRAWADEALARLEKADWEAPHA